MLAVRWPAPNVVDSVKLTSNCVSLIWGMLMKRIHKTEMNVKTQFVTVAVTFAVFNKQLLTSWEPKQRRIKGSQQKSKNF